MRCSGCGEVPVAYKKCHCQVDWVTDDKAPRNIRAEEATDGLLIATGFQYEPTVGYQRDEDDIFISVFDNGKFNVILPMKNGRWTNPDLNLPMSLAELAKALHARSSAD